MAEAELSKVLAYTGGKFSKKPKQERLFKPF